MNHDPPRSLAVGGVLDPEVLADLHELDPEGDVFPGIVRLFVDEAEGRLDAMRGAAGDQRDAVAHAAHSLRGSSGSLGALRLADLCAALEAAARAGDTAAVVGMVPVLERELLEAGRALTAAFPDPQASSPAERSGAQQAVAGARVRDAET